MTKVRLLSRKDVESVLTMADAISILEDAFSELAQKRVIMPTRTPIRNEEADGVSLFMPAFIPKMGALGAKIVTVYPNNPSKHNLPAVMGLLILIEAETGRPICVMDAGYLTAVRTGAVSGLATKYLARQDSKIHTIFGTGVQARTQAWAVATARKLEKCICYSIDPHEKKQAFAQEVEKLTNVPTVVADDPREATESADILTLATSAKQPVIDGNWVKPGTHINGIGSHAPAMREIDTLTVLKSKIICDNLDACKAEAGDFLIPIAEGAFTWDQVHAELGQVITGEKPGRENDQEITLFKSVGLAIQDISTAHFVYEKAKQADIGTDFDL